MAAQAQPVVQIGKFKLGKKSVYLVRLLLIGLLAWIVYIAPPVRYWPMWLAAAAWIAFSIYWSAAAKNSAEAKTSESAESRRVHVLLTNVGQLLLFIPIPGLRSNFLPVSPLWTPTGLAILAASIALAVWARRHLGRNWSGRIEIKTDHELVRTGPYRILRHPIYSAVLGMCVGTALVDQHVHALVGVALVMIAYWRKIRMEEAKLREGFGAQYDDYRRATWRLVPGLF
jgi:protein-S-isoprenylcysteine O-methyltransferase Ste14